LQGVAAAGRSLRGALAGMLAGLHRANLALVVTIGVSIWACLELSIACRLPELKE